MLEDLCKNVHHSVIPNSAKLEIRQKPIDRMVRLWYIHTMEYGKAMTKNELQLRATHKSHNSK